MSIYLQIQSHRLPHSPLSYISPRPSHPREKQLPSLESHKTNAPTSAPKPTGKATAGCPSISTTSPPRLHIGPSPFSGGRSRSCGVGQDQRGGHYYYRRRFLQQESVLRRGYHVHLAGGHTAHAGVSEEVQGHLRSRRVQEAEGCLSCQLLDIRGKTSLAYLESPNLKFLNKSVVHVELVEGQEDSFLKEVINNFPDPGNTVVCVLDNFDGVSLKVAEFLWKNGFKEAYAIKGGVRGKDGWQAVQEEFIPPSMHVTPRKKKYKAPIDVNIAEKLNGNDIPKSKALSLVDENDSSKESNNL